MGHVIAVIAALLLAGCGTVGSTKLDVAAAKFAAFEIKDDRPIEERESSISRNSYGELSRLGDDAITPSGPQLLKAWLGRKLGERLSGKTIVLKEFSVQVVDPKVTLDGGGFSSAMAATPAANPVSGLLALVFIGAIESAKSNKTVGVRITGTIDNVEFLASGGGSFKGRVSEANINSVITQALDHAASEIERLIKESPALPSNPPLQPTPGSGG